MYNLIFIFAANLTPGMQPAYLGEYFNLESCQSAIREIYITQINPTRKRIPEIEKNVEIALQFQKSYICLPQKKIDR
jgi:hypothetical protein